MNQRAYMSAIWESRYFWMHLVLSDLRVKYRRSFLGLAWALIQPLMLTLLLSFVMSHFFHVAMNEYGPFVFSGIIFWEFITTSTLLGCDAFLLAGGYISQFSHPLMIYSLRCVLICMINLLCASVGLIIWVLIWDSSKIGMSWLSLIFSFPLLIFLALPVATISAFIGTQFRDFKQLLLIMLQAIYYISPIMFLPKMYYSANIGYLMEYNPIFHLLNLFRMPLLQNEFPASNDYTFVIISGIVMWFFAIFVIYRQEKNVIFYI